MGYSRIIAGAMNWGVWSKNLNTNQQASLINHCLSLGVTTFDHADIYGGYTTEASFGKAFTQSEVGRDAVQFISKCGIQYPADTRENRVKHYQYDKEYIIWSVETSLKNLHTDYLDLLLLHRPSPLMHPDEIAEAIDELQTSGKILDFGVSNFTPSQTDLIDSKATVQVNQIEFSLTTIEAMFNGSLDHMMANDIIPMAWSPLGSYFKEENETTSRIKPVLTKLSEKYETGEDQLILAWLLHHPSGIHPVVGTTNEVRLKKAVEALDIELELQDWFELLVASQGHKVP
ncbi:aldo/keto reductase [Spongiivirga citrea]|uniref:Aldo/keto reductase n=1 Tax=Spongiivirga citrea TaxID=1481457 RepID=A0A6M0CHD2_9FLAO|nr:aldo/keto reductase [Spongiivirga citrea]NER17255.1 aldo/keto reductase [Spongiivirga citrea]